ncbi:heavy metal-responsive transcriptional regulator [Rhizohabitans arisaemae]|uniref:heavy metal-responsive transcriptional regulator n=1 Tax=Rhizohabitans arisaemae TaxID=2720610 RepID=UPI003D160EF3
MRIGVLAEQAGVSAKTIRFYEEAGLLPAPPRTSAGYRDYPEGAATRLRFIRDAQTAGLTLAEIRGILAIRDSGHAPCRHVTDLIDEHLARIDQRMAELDQARQVLRGLRRRADVTDPADCASEQVCSILARPAGDSQPAGADPRSSGERTAAHSG